MDGRIVGCLIGDLDDDAVAVLGIDRRPREHAVDGEDLFALAKLCYSGFLQLHA